MMSVREDFDVLDDLMERSGGRLMPSNPDILLVDMSADDMKFSNNDLGFDDVMERSGGRLVLSNPDIFGV